MAPRIVLVGAEGAIVRLACHFCHLVGPAVRAVPVGQSIGPFRILEGRSLPRPTTSAAPKAAAT